MSQELTILVFGATGGTGQHFVRLALQQGHRVRALVRNPSKLSVQDPKLDVHTGSITNTLDLDRLLEGTDVVVAMLGDVKAQRSTKINTAFVKELVPAMRNQNVKTFLYQAGGLSTPYGETLPPILWILRHTMISFFGYDGQHRDNEAVMEYLETNAKDIDWIVHRAGIGSDGPSKGILKRSPTEFSVATFVDCATYNLATVKDSSAFHTSNLSTYQT